jgi:hypothetical protein
MLGPRHDTLMSHGIHNYTNPYSEDLIYIDPIFHPFRDVAIILESIRNLENQPFIHIALDFRGLPVTLHAVLAHLFSSSIAP